MGIMYSKGKLAMASNFIAKEKTHKMIEITMIVEERNIDTTKGKDIEVD